MRKYLSIAIRVLLIILCFYYIFHELDFIQFKHFLSGIEWHYLFPVLGILVLNYFILGRRLNSLVYQQGGSGSESMALKISIMATAINNLFPAKMGELAKVYLIHSKQNLSVFCSLSVVFFERFADVNILFVLLIFASLQVSINLEPFLFAVVLLWFFLVLSLKFNNLFFKVTQFTPKLIHTSLKRLHTSLNEAISYKNLAILLIYTLIIWCLYFFQVWFIITLILKMDLSVGQLLVVFVVSSLGMAVPSTPGSFGVYEASMILALSWYEIDKEQAIIGAFLCHMIQFLPPIFISLIILLKMPVNIEAVKMVFEKKNNNSDAQ